MMMTRGFVLSISRPIRMAPKTAPPLLAAIISEAFEIGMPASRSTGTVQASTVIRTSQQQKNDTQRHKVTKPRPSVNSCFTEALGSFSSLTV